MAYETERLREAACGCRYDVVTGIYTHWCPEHEAMIQAEEEED